MDDNEEDLANSIRALERDHFAEVSASRSGLAILLYQASLHKSSFNIDIDTGLGGV